MPKNKGKGGKNWRKGKKRANDHNKAAEFPLKQDGQEYAQVLRMLGDCRLDGRCNDGKKGQCHIRGKFYKKDWIDAGDIILVGLRYYQDEKADVIFKYGADQAQFLKANGHLSENIDLNEGISAAVDEDDNEAPADNFVEFLTEKVD